jgi:hypothetical protein
VLGNSNSELELTPELTVFFIRVGVELERNFEINGSSWSEVAIDMEWSWSGILQLVGGVGAELELMSFFQLRFNSC